MFEVLKMEESITKTGKRLKRVMLEVEGKQYPYKNVTIWEDFPGFDTIQLGVKLNGEILEKDSGNPNPHAPGKNYINRTLVAARNPNGTMAPNTNVDTRLNNIESRLSNLEKSVFGKKDDYPESTGEISFEDSPF